MKNALLITAMLLSGCSAAGHTVNEFGKVGAVVVALPVAIGSATAVYVTGDENNEFSRALNSTFRENVGMPMMRGLQSIADTSVEIDNRIFNFVPPEKKAEFLADKSGRIYAAPPKVAAAYKARFGAEIGNVLCKLDARTGQESCVGAAG